MGTLPSLHQHTMAAVSRVSAFAQRKAYNLAPTVRTSAKGVPIVSGINLGNRAAGNHDVADHGHAGGFNAMHRADVVAPKWSAQIGLGASGVMTVTSHQNALPTRPSYQQRLSRPPFAGAWMRRTSRGPRPPTTLASTPRRSPTTESTPARRQSRPLKVSRILPSEQWASSPLPGQRTSSRTF